MESEEWKNFDEHVDIKHEVTPISQLVPTIKTTSEVRRDVSSAILTLNYRKKLAEMCPNFMKAQISQE